MSQFDFNEAQKAMNITKGREKARSAQPGGKRDLKSYLVYLAGLYCCRLFFCCCDVIAVLCT